MYKELELPLASILGTMESDGVKVDKQILVEMGHDLEIKLQAIEQDIYALAGEKFNINSPKQLGVILFEKIGLTPIKKTKTGYSTAADVLEKLAREHEIIEQILTISSIRKVKFNVYRRTIKRNP